jgi:protein subunit release factor B
VERGRVADGRSARQGGALWTRCATMKTATDFQTARAARLARLRLAVEDFEEKFARSSGPGGQHVNKVSTSVTLKHLPTGTAVTVQDSRSQSMNRQLAWTRLLDAIAPRPYGVKKRMLENKRRRGETKKARRSVGE